MELWNEWNGIEYGMEWNDFVSSSSSPPVKVILYNYKAKVKNRREEEERSPL